MHKRCWMPALALATAICAVYAQEPEVSSRPRMSFEVDAVSKYLWRGFLTNDSPSMQPSVTVGYRGLSVNLWSNISSRAQRNQAWTESDVTVEYGRQLGKWAVTGGFIDYQFVDTPAVAGNRSSEIYVGCAYAGPLTPSFRVYRDIELGDGYYYSASIAKSIRLPHGIRASSLLGVGLNQHQYQSQTTISNVESTTSFDLYRNESISIVPFVTVMVGHRSLFGTHAAFGLRATIER